MLLRVRRSHGSLRMNTTSQATTHGDASQRGVVDSLEALSRAWQASKLYSPDHPATRDATNAAATRLASAFAQSDSITIGIGHGRFLFDDDADNSESLAPLAEVLHELDIAAIEFQRGAGSATMAAFLQTLSRAQREHIRGDDLVGTIEHATRKRIRIVPLRYDGLRIVKGERASKDRDAGEAGSWSDLVQSLLSGSTQQAGWEPDRLAAQLNAQFEQAPDDVIASGRDHLEELTQTLGTMSEGTRTESVGRLGIFLSGLSPNLRTGLLTVDPENPEASLNMFGELAEVLPVGEVLGALERVDQFQAKPSREILMLYKTLARLAAPGGDETTRITRTLKHWHDAGTVSKDVGEAMQEALNEVLEAKGSESFSPEAYKAQLDQVTGGGRSTVSAAQDMASFDADEVQAHAVAVAVQLARDFEGDEGGQTDCVGVLGYLSDMTPDLLQRGRADLVLESARVAQHLVTSLEDCETRKAAKVFLEGFQGSEGIDRILRCAVGGDRANRDALTLLKLGGAPAKRRLIAALTSAAPDCAKALLQELVDPADRQLCFEIARKLAAQDLESLQRMVSTVQSLPVDLGAPVLCGTMHLLLDPPRVKHAARARWLAGILSKMGDEPDVRAVLKRWRFSLTRLLSVLAGRPGKHQGPSDA